MLSKVCLTIQISNTFLTSSLILVEVRVGRTKFHVILWKTIEVCVF